MSKTFYDPYYKKGDGEEDNSLALGSLIAEGDVEKKPNSKYVRRIVMRNGYEIKGIPWGDASEAVFSVKETGVKTRGELVFLENSARLLLLQRENEHEFVVRYTPPEGPDYCVRWIRVGERIMEVDPRYQAHAASVKERAEKAVERWRKRHKTIVKQIKEQAQALADARLREAEDLRVETERWVSKKSGLGDLLK